MNIEESVQHYLNQHQIHKNDGIVIGVSGGVDSMCLLSILQKLQYRIHVVHVNYHLRGEDSEMDAELVQSTCAHLKVDFQLYSENLSAFNTGIQEEARKRRHQLIRACAKNKEARYVALAHHQGDQQETLLFNLFRGTGLSGLVNMMRFQAPIIRPFLQVNKKAILAYAEDNQIPFREDASNKKNVYSRNLIRNKLLPQFEELFTDYQKRLEVSASQLNRQAELYRLLVDQKMQQLLVKQSFYSEYDLSEISSSNEAAILLFEFFKKDGFRYQQFEDLFSSTSPETKKILSKKYSIYLKGATIYHIHHTYLEKPEDIQIQTLPFSTLWGAYEIKLELKDHAEAETQAKGYSCHLDYDRIVAPLSIRSYGDGDRIRFKEKGSKKISDVFTDAGFPSFKRKLFPIIYLNHEPISVAGMQTSYQYKVSTKTNKVLSITIQESATIKA